MTIVQIAQGELRGTEDSGVLRFAGIPFAEPPTGQRRFRPPEAHAGWDGVRDASTFGPTSVQGPDPLMMLTGADPEPIDEDCLYLNVWTPGTDGAKRPVMVWIHGGGFLMGSGSSPVYHGQRFVERGDVVYVSFNYRLGALGFLHLAHLDPDYAGSGNNGILDQVAALEWVRDNIAAFGGDPDNVTIFGESAGGMSVCTLLGMPAAKGLFHRAIAQSGAAHNVQDEKQAAAITDGLFEKLGVSSIEELLSVDAEEFAKVQDDLMGLVSTELTAATRDEGRTEGIRLPFQPVHDGAALPEPPLEAVRNGLSAHVEFLSGTNLDEVKLFEIMMQGTVSDELVDKRLDHLFGDHQRARSAYENGHGGLDAPGLASAVYTDAIFRQPAIRLSEVQSEHQASTYHYLFTWATSTMGGMLGSCHALEIPFVFDNLDAPGLSILVGEGVPEGLSEAMQDAWIAFARTGNPAHPGLPDWPGYSPASRSVMEFGVTTRLLDDPYRDIRELWNTVL